MNRRSFKGKCVAKSEHTVNSGHKPVADWFIFLFWSCQRSPVSFKDSEKSYIWISHSNLH